MKENQPYKHKEKKAKLLFKQFDNKGIAEKNPLYREYSSAVLLNKLNYFFK